MTFIAARKDREGFITGPNKFGASFLFLWLKIVRQCLQKTRFEYLFSLFGVFKTVTFLAPFLIQLLKTII